MKVYKQSDTMELAAMANMLSYLSVRGLLLGHKAIVIQMDNLTALRYLLRHMPGQAYVAKTSDIKFKPSKNPVTKTNSPMLDMIRDLLDEFEIVYLKHVKGHQTKEAQQSSGRVGVHERCDKAAKAARKAQKLNIEEVKE